MKTEIEKWDELFKEKNKGREIIGIALTSAKKGECVLVSLVNGNTFIMPAQQGNIKPGDEVKYTEDEN